MKYLPGEAGLREGRPALALAMSPGIASPISRASLARTRSPSSINAAPVPWFAG